MGFHEFLCCQRVEILFKSRILEPFRYVGLTESIPTILNKVLQWTNITPSIAMESIGEISQSPPWLRRRTCSEHDVMNRVRVTLINAGYLSFRESLGVPIPDFLGLLNLLCFRCHHCCKGLH